MSCVEKGPVTATDCDPCSTAVRNHWFRGKMVTAADYALEQRYMIRRRRMINQSALGFGIVSGFNVESEAEGIAVCEGVAFDRYGRELFACERVHLGKASDVLWLEEGKCGLSAGKPASEPGEYVLSAHYAERDVNGVRIGSDCGDSDCVPNHICETVVYSLRHVCTGDVPLRVEKCKAQEPRANAKPDAVEYRPKLAHPYDDRGLGNLCLCHEKHDGHLCCDPCCAPDLARWMDFRLDFNAGVPLAIVNVKLDECDHPAFADVIQIIHACQLTRIQDLGWRNWHERPDLVISFANFARMFVAPQQAQAQQVQNEDIVQSSQRRRRERQAVQPEKPASRPPVATRFWVCFSAPVQVSSITRDVVSMTLIQRDNNEEVGEMYDVPIAGVCCGPKYPNDPDKTTRGFYFFVHHRFWRGEIDPESASGFDSETQVQLRIDGNSIVDWKGRPIDGDSPGRRLPTGNRSWGGTCLSSWRVAPQGSNLPPHGPVSGEPEAKPKPEPADTNKGAQAAS
jgi:hypothetical protein